MNPRSLRSLRGGYTLIELVMVVLILGIILSVTFTKVDYLSPRYALRAVARDIARTVALARSQAASQGRIYFVKYLLDDKRYYILAPIVDAAPAESATPSAGASAIPIPQLHWEPVFKQSLPQGIVFKDIVVGADKVVEKSVNVEISPFGFTKAHSVHLTDGRNDYTLDISPLTGLTQFHEEYVDPPAVEEDATK